MVDGRIEGTWRLRGGKPEINPFTDLDAGALAAESTDVVRSRHSLA
jgi:hypothetical protein